MTTKIDNILTTVEKYVVPDEEDVKKLLSYAEDFKRKIYMLFNDILREESNVFIGGSISRGTFLKDEFDIDIFIRFPKDLEINLIKEILFERLKKIFPKEKIRKRYAEHPYAEVILNNIRLNVVPSYKTRYPEWISPADRSYYHDQYLKEKNIMRLRRDIVITKSFLKGIGVYGAEVYVGGFSGYLTELLVYYYNGFKNFIKNVSKWKPPVIIDIESQYTDKNDIFRMFGYHHLIVVDPVDKGRNVAAAVSKRKFSMLISAVNTFLINPSREFFHVFRIKPEINLQALQSLVSEMNILVLELKHGIKIEDIHYPQLMSVCRKIVKQLETNGFNVIKYDVYSDYIKKSLILILLDNIEIPNYQRSVGPYPFFKGEKNFLVKNKGTITWIDRDGRWYALRRRRYINAIQLVKEIFRTKVIKIPERLYTHIDIYILDRSMLTIKLGKYLEWINSFIYGEEFWKRLI